MWVGLLGKRDWATEGDSKLEIDIKSYQTNFAQSALHVLLVHL